MNSSPRNNNLVGLPSTPRSQRQMLSPLDTTMSMHSPASTHSSHTLVSSESYTYAPSEKPSRSNPQQVFTDPRIRNHDSLLFANAVIPLSPTSSTSSAEQPHDQPLNGLAPRRRNGLARLFCCFGRDERARRRFARENDYEKVGNDLHWSEY